MAASAGQAEKQRGFGLRRAECGRSRSFGLIAASARAIAASARAIAASARAIFRAGSCNRAAPNNRRVASYPSLSGLLASASRGGGLRSPTPPGRRTPERRRRAGRLERRRAGVPLSLQGWPLCWQSSYCWDPAQCAKAVSSASSGKAIRSQPVGLPRLHHMVASAARPVSFHKRTARNGSSAGVAAGCILRGHH